MKRRTFTRLASSTLSSTLGGTLGSTLLFQLTSAHGATTLLGIRVWPAKEYTRVTLELDQSVKFTQTVLADPPRLYLDLDGIDIDPQLRDIVSKVQADDPYIKTVRVGQNRPKVIRLVFDLKEMVKPQLFELAPVANYKTRLVLDLYPVKAIDPLAALIAKAEILIDPKDAKETAKDASKDASKDKPKDPLGDLITETNKGSSTDPSAPKQPEKPSDSIAKAPVKTKPIVNRLVTIAIDPGHGGEDPGAVGSRGTKEKDVVLLIAKALEQKINAEPNLRAYLTRDSDYFVPLAIRVAKARRVQADIFISVHADAFVDRRAKGASVFVLSERGATSAAARWIAAKENGADAVGGVNFKGQNKEVSSLLRELSATAQIQSSTRLAKAVLSEVGGIGSLHSEGVEQAGFAVLKAPDMTSILVETAFISNPDEEARLSDGKYQDKLASAVFKGIRAHLIKNPPPPKLVV
jgi:N-acetylmuramoyl-L-alanine amidase